MNNKNLKEMILTLEELRDYEKDFLKECEDEDETAFEHLKKEVDALNYCIALLKNMEEE